MTERRKPWLFMKRIEAALCINGSAVIANPTSIRSACSPLEPSLNYWDRHP